MAEATPTNTAADEAADDTAAGSTPATGGGDERLVHRGPIQRLLVRPEIGALIGAAGIWIFFWAATEVFGTAAGAANYLDVAVTLGIMAVAVSMLMIGGEFDLSSGAMTGATGILVILLVKETGEFGGAGLTLWIAIPLSFVIALGVGWFNGTMVERTSLPSFIVTLGTFFMLKGGKLGFSKLFTDKVIVEGIDQAHGYDFWRRIFASSWIRNDHVFDARDVLYTALVIIGVVLVVLGLLELTYTRAERLRTDGLIVALVGAAAALGGFAGLLTSDGTGANTVFGLLVGVGIVVSAYGVARWRYAPATGGIGAVSLPGEVVRLVVGGLVAVAVGVVAAVALDSSSQTEVGFLLTVQGARAVLFVGLAVAGVVALAVAASRLGDTNRGGRLVVQLLAAAVVAALALLVRAESASTKFRAELFTVMLLVATFMVVGAVLELLFERRRHPDDPADRLGRLVASTGVVVVVVGVAVNLLYSTAEENAATTAVTQFRIGILWFIVFSVGATWVLLRTRFGSWTFAVGGNAAAARSVGVPAARTKTTLFMLVSAAAWLVGMLLAFRLNSVQASTGDGKEFEYIIAAVVGGNLLTGGYGSAVGAAVGGLIIAMSRQGIPLARWNSNWQFLFLGVILLLAVLVNNYVRTKAEASR